MTKKLCRRYFPIRIRSIALTGLAVAFTAASARSGIPSGPVQGEPNTYQIQVYQIKAIDDLEGRFMGDPDFELTVEMGPRKFVSKKSGDPIRPNWIYRVKSAAKELKVRLMLWEADYPSNAEFCDVNPRKGERILSYTIPSAGSTMRSSSSFPPISVLNLNQTYTIRGEGDSHRCEIKFRVTRTGAGL